ncbi:MAG: D-TA family PLP-dependent enzyme [Bacteroidales bacterium]|nr:D-TA family PLP-dependent enzyme [Bacteroidales bacterium]MCL2738569.1 D-TA family PLP-dependent enzyme [Bacteroidales bacterium]
MNDWYRIDNIGQIDSPALVVYPKRISANIEWAKTMVGSVDRLRPHVKTNKMKEVCRLAMQAGIVTFKCSTIAEAEMLALCGSPDILLAYQPVGPKISRLIKLVKAYPESRFSCIVDDMGNTSGINDLCGEENVAMDVYIDLNVGMNRTGIHPLKAVDLAKAILSFKNIRLVGLHGYDGHVRENELMQRQTKADTAYAAIDDTYRKLQPMFPYPLEVVVGGSPAFSVHARRTNCVCSPGTFVFWDWNHKNNYPEMPFEYAALVICRIVSIIDRQHVCVDLGHKSVAAENPLPRVHFLNVPEAKSVSQSEEHLVLEVPDSSHFSIGQVLYGVPGHICPTVALYEKAFVIEQGKMTDSWNVMARNRCINI